MESACEAHRKRTRICEIDFIFSALYIRKLSTFPLSIHSTEGPQNLSEQAQCLLSFVM